MADSSKFVLIFILEAEIKSPTEFPKKFGFNGVFYMSLNAKQKYKQ